MRRSWLGGLAAMLAITLCSCAGPAEAADSSYGGNWKVNLIQGAQEITLALLQVEDKEGKLQAKALNSPVFKSIALKDFKADAGAIHFTLTADDNDFQITVHPPRGETAPKKLLGTIRVGTNYELALLEKTDKKEINRKEALVPIEGGKALQEAAQTRDPKELAKGIKEVLANHAGKPVAYVAGRILLQVLPGAKDADVEDVKTAAEATVKAATPFGREAELGADLLAAQALARVEKGAADAVTYARKAEKLLGDSDPLGRQAAVLKALVAALRKAGQADEARTAQTRLAKLNEQLDQEFAKNAIPFPTEPFPGRKGKSERVVLVELFTGAQCPPCVSADIAFDAALKTYQPSQAVFLQYHLHIPRPDPLTNADSEGRQNYYGDEIQGTPSAFVDGKPTQPLGGLQQHAKDRFGALKSQINEDLEKDAGAKIKLAVERKGDQIAIQAEVADLKKTGEKVRLRLVLVEDVVAYAGTNGQRLHHHVVRAFPGGVEGFALTDKKAEKKTATVALAEISKKLNEYLEAAGKKRPFLDEDRPLGLKHLKIVAFVQDDENKEVLQAAQADVPEAK
jgi:hypothetical protein